jgi:hypothetical protein
MRNMIAAGAKRIKPPRSSFRKLLLKASFSVGFEPSGILTRRRMTAATAPIGRLM